MRKVNVIITVFILLLASQNVRAADNEWMYVTPHILKTAVMVGFDGLAIAALALKGGDSPWSIPWILAVSLVGMPSAFILHDLAVGDRNGVRTWRTVSIFTDAVGCFALGAVGFYLSDWYNRSLRFGSKGDLASMGAGITIFLSGSFLANALMDLKPFAVESAAPPAP
jgi:hypothetical protein